MKRVVFSVSGFKGSALKALFASILAIMSFIAGPQAASAQSFSNESAWSDGTNLYYQATYTGSYAHFNVYIDTDTNASTGYSINGIGGDYLIEDTGFYKYSGAGGGWGWTSASGTVSETYPQSGTVKFSIALSAVGNPMSATVAFQATDANWNATTDPNVVSTNPTYFVSPSGNDANPGSISQPWRTPQHAANVVGAGSTVYLRAGTYGQFDVNVSGSSTGGYITFTSYPGETAVIDGTGWTANYDHGLVHIQNQNYIKIAGLEIRNATSTSSTSSPVGVMVEGSGSYIQILNNYIHNITNTASSNGNARGILVRGDSSSADIDNVTISGNTLCNLQTGWSESCTLNGDVNGFTVSNNTIHDNNNIGLVVAGGYGVSPLVDQARNGTVSGNTIYNCSTLNNPYYNAYTCAGLYVDGGTSTTIERNIVHNCDIGVETASEKWGWLTTYVTVRNNLIYSNTTPGIKIGGYNATSTGGTDHCTFVNNTLYNDDTADWWCGEIAVCWRATNNVFDNNIIYAGPQEVFVKDSGTDGASVGTFDYNEYYSTGGTSNAKWQWVNQTNWMYTFGTWQSTSGQDAHSTFADPLFVSTSTPNFNVQSGSPALNSGNYGLGSGDYGTVDFAGNPRTKNGAIDMGAYED